MIRPEYQILIDWDGLGGLNFGSFERGLDDWHHGGATDALPTVATSTEQAYDGTHSLKIVWPTGGSFIHAGRNLTGFIPGRQYVVWGRVYVPAGQKALKWAVDDAGVGSPSTVTDQWTLIGHMFTATKALHSLQIWPDITTTAGDYGYLDRPYVLGPGADVSGRIMDRSSIAIQYGRDQARSLSPTAPGRMTGLELDNRSRDYYPDNTSSALNGYILPARPVRVTARTADKAYTLFDGRLDDFELVPQIERRSVSFTGLDGLAQLRETTISTDLYPSIQTGEAIARILDAAGWPVEARDLDHGATTIRWWHEDNVDATSAMERIVRSEGPSALLMMSPDGAVVFRDRHHRLTRAASLTSQATFRGADIEPVMSAPFVYDQGWRDIVNSFELQVQERVLSGDLSVVWETDQIYSLSSGETLRVGIRRSLLRPGSVPAASSAAPAFAVEVQSDEPFAGAVVPEADVDYTLLSGSVTVSLSRTSGKSLSIYLRAVGGPAVIQGLALRAQTITTERVLNLEFEDALSVERYKKRSLPSEHATHWAGIHDAEAIGQLILGQYAERRPTATFRLVNANTTRLTQQLSRDISDRITIIEAETGLDDEFFIEQIRHDTDGLEHSTVFGCEKAPVIITGAEFVLDTSLLGTGVLGQSGVDDPAAIMILDSRLLDTATLAW